MTQSRKARYQLQRAAQGLLPQERVAHCQRSTMSGSGVGVYRSANGGASFCGLATCGSVWHCPVCAAKITEMRRQELQAAINTWAKHGGTVYLMSLTFPHQINQSLDSNLKLFTGALGKFKESRIYKNVMAAVGSAGSIRAMEVTHGIHGWHPHTHDLIFAKPEQLEALQALQMTWIETLIKVGIADRSQINDMLKAAFDVQNGDYAAEYVAKFGHEASEASKTLTDSHWGASSEMTKSYAKVGKRLGGRTPFTLLADYIKGDKASGELFTEFGLCFKGKRQLFWSPKLTAALKLLGYDRHEKTDEEIAAESMPEREFVTTLNHEQWKLVLSRNARFEVLRAAQDDGAEGVTRLLEELAGRKQTHQGVYCYQEYGGHKYNRPYWAEMH
ncbi:MAG: hypothetical protein EPN14_08010 [Gallionella sp.]|nr:MAG: hypothetical protein EPN14_08010 [Gallionella sp.]